MLCLGFREQLIIVYAIAALAGIAFAFALPWQGDNGGFTFDWLIFVLVFAIHMRFFYPQYNTPLPEILTFIFLFCWNLTSVILRNYIL